MRPAVMLRMPAMQYSGNLQSCASEAHENETLTGGKGVEILTSDQRRVSYWLEDPNHSKRYTTGN